MIDFRESLQQALVRKITHNGIDDSYSKYDREKLITLNSFLFICILVSLFFLVFGLVAGFIYLAKFSVIYYLFFQLAYLGISFKKLDLMRYSYLFVANFSVLSISAALGYYSGFYFYFFITPLSINIFMEGKSNIVKALSLSSCVINVALMHYLFYIRDIPPLESVNEIVVISLFYFNLLLSFLFCLLLLKYFLKRNLLKSEEARLLLENKLILESEIHKSQLLDAKNNYQIEKLKNEKAQLSVFSHIISHDLRGPISRVAGLVELIKADKNWDEEQKAIVEHINHSVHKMDEIIRDLNYILVQKKLGYDSFSRFSIRELISEVIQTLEKETKETSAKLEVQIEVEFVVSKYAILHSVLYNLLSNAIKYRKPGEAPDIKIQTTRSENGILISVKDCGIGMDLVKNKDRLFQLYSRFNEDEDVEGKGIGLFLVKNHIELLGGEVEIKSEYMNGTEIFITIPDENSLPAKL